MTVKLKLNKLTFSTTLIQPFASTLFTQSVNSRLVPQRGIKRHARSVFIALKERQKKYYESLSDEERNEIEKRSNFIEWNYSAEIFAFGKRLHEEFHSELLLQAFTHRSYIRKELMKQKDLGVEYPEVNMKDNDNLASEGEKVIKDFSGRYVSHFFPRFPLEGINSTVNFLTSDELLGHISKNLGTTFLILSEKYPVDLETYSKTLKAIIGALKECQGLQRSELFVRDFIVTQMAGKDINDFLNISNPMEALTKILENDGKNPPEPRIIFQSGMKTILANYHVGIYSNKQLIGHCSGETVDTAIEMAAFDALKRLFHTTDSCNPMTYDYKEPPESITNLRLSEWNSAAFRK